MITPERNDVNVSKLFKWFGEFIIEDLNGEQLEKIYVRLVGDADMNRARTMALRESAKMREKLRDPDSDERIAYIPLKDDVDREKIESFILLTRTKGAYNKIVKEVNIPFPKELDSDATLEQQEKYQAEVDLYPKKVNQAVEKEMSKLLDKERASIAGLSDDELYDRYVKDIINEICETHMFDVFTSLCAYYGTYSDKQLKVRRFESYEEFQDLPHFIKGQFQNAYKQLEIDMNEVKK